jgi:hypothetical protein
LYQPCQPPMAVPDELVRRGTDGHRTGTPRRTEGRFLIVSAGRVRLCTRPAPPAVPEVVPVRCGLARRSSLWWDRRLPRGTGEVLSTAATIRAGDGITCLPHRRTLGLGCGNEKNESYRHCWAPDPTAATAEQAARLTGVRAAAAGARPWRPSSRCLIRQSRARRPAPGSAAARMPAKQPLTEQGQVE